MTVASIGLDGSPLASYSYTPVSRFALNVRFLQTDPIRFSAGDGNLYRYVANNPINRWDSLGLSQESEKENSTEEGWPRPPGPGPRPRPGPSDDRGRSTTLVATGNERGGANSGGLGYAGSGSWDLSVSGGRILGGGVNISDTPAHMSPNGRSACSLNVMGGLGYGAGFSFTRNENFGNPGGVTGGGFGSTGNGIRGGRAAGGTSEQGDYFSSWVGWGLGAGVGFGVGWTFKLK